MKFFYYRLGIIPIRTLTRNSWTKLIRFNFIGIITNSYSFCNFFKKKFYGDFIGVESFNSKSNLQLSVLVNDFNKN